MGFPSVARTPPEAPPRTDSCSGTVFPHDAIVAMRELFPKDGYWPRMSELILILSAALETGGPGNLLVSNGWSSMGFGIPAAIAAKLVQPGRPVLACVGDGGFLMMVGKSIQPFVSISRRFCPVAGQLSQPDQGETVPEEVSASRCGDFRVKLPAF